MPKKMATLVSLSVDDLVKEIAEHQARTLELFQQLSETIEKRTEGNAFLSDDNANAAKYWLKVAEEHPEILASICDVEDFKTKALAFEAINNVRKQVDNIAIVLKSPRDIISRDCYWYISYVSKQAKALQSNPIFKKIVQDAPVLREASKKEKTPPTVVSSN